MEEKFLCGRQMIRVAFPYVVHEGPATKAPSGVRHGHFCYHAIQQGARGRESPRTRIRMLALRSVKDESITCYKNEIRIGVLDDDRSRAVGSWLRDSVPIR